MCRRWRRLPRKTVTWQKQTVATDPGMQTKMSASEIVSIKADSSITIILISELRTGKTEMAQAVATAVVRRRVVTRVS